jgi:hypothetical protein
VIRTAGSFALGLAVFVLTACTTPPPEADVEPRPWEVGASLLPEIVQGSTESVDRFGRIYEWSIEGLTDCKGGTQQVISGRNPLARALLKVAQGSHAFEEGRAEFFAEMPKGVAAEWLVPWQQALCNSLDIEVFVDPLKASMRDEGGEGLSRCLDLGFLCLMELGKRVDQSTVPYASGHVRDLLLAEINEQRQNFSADKQRLTDVLDVLIEYDNQFDVKVSVEPRLVEVWSLFGTRLVASGPPLPRMAVSAVFARAVYVRAAATAWGSLLASINRDDTPKSAFYEVVRAAALLQAEFRSAFRFALAHELAHLYLGDGMSPNADHALADCAAILQLGESGSAVHPGVFDLFEKAYSERREYYFGLSPDDRSQIEYRSELFQRALDAVRTAESSPVPLEFCKQGRREAVSARR